MLVLNFGLADSFLRFIETKNDFKEMVTRFQKYVFLPRFIGVRTLQIGDKMNDLFSNFRLYVLMMEMPIHMKNYFHLTTFLDVFSTINKPD